MYAVQHGSLRIVRSSYMTAGFSAHGISYLVSRYCMLFYDLASQVTQHHFYYILLVRMGEM
jgi:hypothetical protein